MLPGLKGSQFPQEEAGHPTSTGDKSESNEITSPRETGTSTIPFWEREKEIIFNGGGHLKRLHENRTIKIPLLKNGSNFNTDREGSSEPRSWYLKSKGCAKNRYTNQERGRVMPNWNVSHPEYHGLLTCPGGGEEVFTNEIPQAKRFRYC